MVATHKYDGFGAVRSSGSGSTEYRFTGQQDDATLGYTYLRARYYDSQTGRFLSKDPVRGTLTNPASQHYYGYAYGNPANWVDPTGLWTAGICVTGILGLGVYVTGSACIVMASEGEIGLTLTGGGGGVSGFASGISVGLQFSSGNKVSDLNGPFATAGASVRLGPGVGADSFAGRNQCGDLIWGGSGQVGVGGNYTPPFFPSFEFHGGATTTGSVSVKISGPIDMEPSWTSGGASW